MTERDTPTSGWNLERSGPDAYEEYLVPPMFDPWAERLLDRVALAPGERVLDVGCGTGVVARKAALDVGTDGAVVGVDANEGMLATAADAAEDRPQIEWKRGDAADLPVTEATFDAAVCQQALQFVPEPAAALEEMYRALATGGRVAVSVWRPLEYNPAYVVLADALERHVGADAGTTMRSPFPDWDGRDLRALVEAAGFEDVAVAIEIGSVRYPSVEAFVLREAASAPFAESVRALDGDVRAALIRDVDEALADYVDDEGVVSPMETYVLTGRRGR